MAALSFGCSRAPQAEARWVVVERAVDGGAPRSCETACAGVARRGERLVRCERAVVSQEVAARLNHHEELRGVVCELE